MTATSGTASRRTPYLDATDGPFLRLPAWTALALALLLCGCGAVYRPAPHWGAGGYSSADIDETTVRVNYLTGSGADPGTARNYALYRCAEIALERGFDGFVVLSGKAYSTGGAYGRTTEATVQARLFKGSAAQIRQTLPPMTEVYDAAQIRQRLERVIRR